MSARSGRPARSGWLPVGVAMAAVAWGGNDFTPLLIMYREHLSDVTVDVLLGAYVLGIVPALLVGGALSDRLGRRPLMLPAVPVSILGSVLLALGARSVALLAVGRVLVGVALGLAMAVGTTWVKELTPAGTAPGAAARRASAALTAGFLVGAGVSAVLAQWAPWPTGLSYAVHVALSLLALCAGILRVPETRPAVPREHRRPLRADLAVPAAGHRRFARVVVPVAPWVFGAAGCAYAVLPALVRERVAAEPIAFSGLLTVLTLGVGFLVQVLGRRLDHDRSARASVLALVFLVAGTGLAALASARLTVALVVLAACVLGVGFGLALVAALQEVQRIAGPDDLAGLTAVFYGLAYVGFFVPAVLAVLVRWWSYPEMFVAGTVLSALCLAVVAGSSRRHLPGRVAGEPGAAHPVDAPTGDESVGGGRPGGGPVGGGSAAARAVAER